MLSVLWQNMEDVKILNIHNNIIALKPANVKRFRRKGGENMQNLDVRNMISDSSLKYWEIAEKLGITDSTFSRKLRKEFSEKEKNKIIEIINEISLEKSIGNNQSKTKR